jgi:hypothetical protein
VDDLMRRAVGLDLNGWHDFAARERDADTDPDSEGPVIVDGGFGGVIVSHNGMAIGGPQAVLSPIGRGNGWSDIGAREKRRDLRVLWPRLLAGAADRDALRDLPCAADALAVHAGRIGVCIPDRPEMGEAERQAVLDALAGSRRPTATLIWRSVALALAALDGGVLPQPEDGMRVLCVLHTADGLEVQGFTLRALADHPGRLAPERAGPGSVLRPEIALDRLLEQAEAAVAVANPHPSDRPTERPRLPLALLLADRAPAEPEVIRRDNGTWTLMHPPAAFRLPWNALPAAPVLEPADVVLLHSPLAPRHLEGLAAWLGVTDGVLHLMPQDAPALGALHALRRIARGMAHYLDRLDQVALAVLRQSGPVFEDLIPPDATVPGNREYVSAPITSMVWPAGMKTVQFFVRKGESNGPYEIRAWTTPELAAPEQNEPLDIRLRQKPAQGWANLLITAPRWDLLRHAPIRLEWSALEVVARTEQEVLDSLRGQPPVVPAPVHYPAHIGLWSGALRKPSLRVLLEHARQGQRGSVHNLANALRSPYSPPTTEGAGPSRFYAIGTDGTLPTGLGAEAAQLFRETITGIADDLMRRLHHGQGPANNDPLLCLTWCFAQCPPAIIEELAAAIRSYEQGRSHPWLLQSHAVVVVFQGLGRVATDAALLEEMIPVLANGEPLSYRAGALAAMLSRPAKTPAVLMKLGIQGLAERLADIIDNLYRGPDFGIRLKYALLAIGGLLRVREHDPWALVAAYSAIADRLARRLDEIAQGLAAHPAGATAAAGKRKSAEEAAKLLRGAGGRPDILTFVDELPD